MNNITHTIAEFLLYSSILLLVLGGIVYLIEKYMRMNEKAAIRVFEFLLFVPLLYAFQHVLPDTSKVQLPVPVVSGWVDETPAGLVLQEGNTVPFIAMPQLVLEQFNTMNTTTPKHVEPKTVSAFSSLHWSTYFIFIWIFISVYLIGKMVWMMFQLSRWSNRAEVVNNPSVLELLDDCISKSNVRYKPSLLTSQSMPVPVTFGCIRPKIMLPKAFLSQVSTDGLRYVLLHELEHLRRWDNFWHIVETIICSVFFFHPVVHWAKRNIHERREHLCDQHVISVTNKKFEYADFLLQEIWRCSQSAAPGIATAFASSPQKTSSRIHNILQQRKTTMWHKIRDYSFVTIVFLMIFMIPFITVGPGSVLLNDAVAHNDELEDTNASPTNEEGVYHVISSYDSIKKVVLFNTIQRKRDKTYTGKELEPSQWEYDYETNKLTVTVDVNNEPILNKSNEVNEGSEHLRVYGKVSVPWKWTMQEPLDGDKTRVLINDREGVRGEDFEVDEEAGKIWFLKKNICTSDTKYYIAYDYKPDPKQAHVMRGGAIGNHDQKAVRKFLGLPIEDDPDYDHRNSIGTNAFPVEPPLVFGLHRPIKEKGMRIGLKINDKKTNDMKYLKLGEDYNYVEETGLITLKEPIGDQFKPDYIFVSGVPIGNTFTFHKGIQENSAGVVLNEGCDNEKVLVEGEGFIVDYVNNTITVIDPLLQEKSTIFLISASCDDGSLVSYGSSCREPEEVDPDFDPNNSVGTNASPVDLPYLFGLAHPMKAKGLQVGLKLKNTQTDNMHYLKVDEDFTYEQETGLITLKEAIADQYIPDYVFVMGVPTGNVFVFHHGIREGSARVVLNEDCDNEKSLAEGEGYIVDYKNGTITVLDPQWKESGTKIMLSTKGLEGGIFSYGSSCKGMNQGIFDSGVDYKKAVHFTALPTDDPNIFKTPQMLLHKGMFAAVVKKDDPHDSTFIKLDDDFAYNSLMRQITLKRDVGMGDGNHVLVVSGIPKFRHEFHFQGPLDPEKLKVYSGDALLEPGLGYKVDYDTGEIEIYGVESKDPYSKFFIQWGPTAFDLYGSYKPKSVKIETP